MFRSALAILLILPAASSSRSKSESKFSKKKKCCVPTHKVYEQTFRLNSLGSDFSYGQSIDIPADDGNADDSSPPSGAPAGGNDRQLDPEPDFSSFAGFPPLPPVIGSLFIDRGCVIEDGETADQCTADTNPLNHYTVLSTVLDGGYDFRGQIPIGATVRKQMNQIDICVGETDKNNGETVPNCFYLRYSGALAASFTFAGVPGPGGGMGDDGNQRFPIPKFTATLYAGLGTYAGAKGEAILEQVGMGINVVLRWIESDEHQNIWDLDYVHRY